MSETDIRQKLKDIQPIKQETVKQIGVQSLSNTPNRSAYGVPGLSAGDLKKRFDSLAELIVGRVNDLLTVLQSDDVAKAITVQGLNSNGIKNFQDIADSIKSGLLYYLIRVDGVTSLPMKLGQMSEHAATLEQSITDLKDSIGIESMPDEAGSVVDYVNLLFRFLGFSELFEVGTVRDYIDGIDDELQNKINDNYNLLIEQINLALSSVFNYRGSKKEFSELPGDAKKGDVWNVENAYNGVYKHYPAGTNFVWNGESWDALGGDLAKITTDLYSLRETLDIYMTFFNAYKTYDHVITDISYLTTENLATMRGRVLVKSVKDSLYGATLKIPSNVSYINFIDCHLYGTGTIEGVASRPTVIEGLRTGVNIVGNFDDFYLINFAKVKNCNGFNLHLHNCSIVEECTATHAINCNYINQLKIKTDEVVQASTGNPSIENCKCVSFVEVALDNERKQVLDLKNCEFVNNIYGDGIVHYENCKHVDGDTCKDYFTQEQIGQVQAITADCTTSTISVYSQEEIDGKIGDIGTILDALHEGGIE